MRSLTWPRSGLRSLGTLALIAALLVLPRPALGSLGGDVSSVKADLTRMNGTEHVVTAGAHAVHEIQLPGGTLVREYLSADGTVFGVTWRGPFRPNLQQLLGAYFDEFQQGAQDAKSRRAGRGPLFISGPNIVAHMAGRSRAFIGRAYIPKLMPSGSSVADIQ
jgi:hypothetical protein